MDVVNEIGGICAGVCLMRIISDDTNDLQALLSVIAATVGTGILIFKVVI